MVMPVAGFDGLGGADYAADYRALGMRGPIVLQSWGYDLNGKPVPNAADTEVSASGGIFASTGLHDKFMDSWLKKSHTWPVAPIDLRFDRARGTWVSPPSYRLVKVDLEEDLSEFGTATCAVVDGETLYNTTGVSLEGTITGVSGVSILGTPRITLTDVVGTTWSSGTRLLAHYDPYNCEYYPLSAGSGASIIEWGRTRPSGLGVVTAGSTATIDIWTGGPTTGDLTDANRTVTAGAPPLLASGSLSGWVLLNKINNYWWIVGARC